MRDSWNGLAPKSRYGRFVHPGLSPPKITRSFRLSSLEFMNNTD